MTAFTTDAFYSGRITLFQPKTGFRAGTDSLLLAAALDHELKGQALELGTGAGGALLPAAFRLPKMNFTGVELDPEMVGLAKRGITENGFEDRVAVETYDAAALPGDWQNQFDLVFSNPPFFEPGTIQAPGTGKERAYLESLTLRDWLNVMLFALRPKGTLTLVHRAADLARILTVLERQTGEITVLPVHSYPGLEAKRILVRARKGLRPGPLRLLEPKYLYTEKGGARTEWALAMQRDGAEIAWN